MANSSIAAAVEEITTTIRSLPPRPTVDEVVGALTVIKSTDQEEVAQLSEIDKAVKPPDLPEELFSVLKQVKKNSVLLRSFGQRREAQFVIELDNKYQVLDELIQRASRIVSGDKGEDEDVRDAGHSGLVLDERGFNENDEKLEDLKDEATAVEIPSKVAQVGTGGKTEKLSLIQVASLIETSAKDKSTTLDLQGKLKDQIEWLPLSLGKLEDVTELNLSENRLMALPPNIGSLRLLTKLDLHSNQLTNLPESFGELLNLTDLDLHANRVQSLPASFGNLSNLVNLNLSSNRLSALPESLGNLTKLRRLNVETNELEELPYTIGSCTSLTELRLDFNQLKALPEAVGKLECLEVLTLHYNRIKGFPSTMGLLSHLKELDVSFNELEFIPEKLCFATTLVKLNVSNNFADLRALPNSLGNLELLEELDISNDQIRVLPDSFRFLSKLKVFRADETPLEVPPRHVIKLGAQAVVNYMSDLVNGRDVSHRPVEKKRQSFWVWFLTLCGGLGKSR